MRKDNKLDISGKSHQIGCEPKALNGSHLPDEAITQQPKRITAHFEKKTECASVPLIFRDELQHYMSVARDAIDAWSASKRFESTGPDYDFELDQAHSSISQSINSFLANSGQRTSEWPVFASKSHFRHAYRCAFQMLWVLMPICDREFKQPLLASYENARLNDTPRLRPRYKRDPDTFLSVLDFVQDMLDEIKRQADRVRFH